MVEFRFHKFTQNVSSWSNHEAQLQWHRWRRRPFQAVYPLSASVQRNLIPDHWYRQQSLTFSRLIKLFHLQNQNSINLSCSNFGWGLLGLTLPEPTVIWEKERSIGVDVTWRPKNVAVLRKVNLTVAFVVTISVATPVESDPAWITNLSNLILWNWSSQIRYYNLIKN